jgi:hypothetical protein
MIYEFRIFKEYQTGASLGLDSGQLWLRVMDDFEPWEPQEKDWMAGRSWEWLENKNRIFKNV